MAEGVFKQDVINFCRCDYMAILRVKGATKADIKQAITNAEALIGKKYDFEFEHTDDEYYCTEMVAKAWEDTYKLEPMVLKALFGLIKKSSIMPDQFWNDSRLEKVYFSKQVEDNFK